jgi:hypothetical protein
MVERLRARKRAGEGVDIYAAPSPRSSSAPLAPRGVPGVQGPGAKKQKRETVGNYQLAMGEAQVEGQGVWARVQQILKEHRAGAIAQDLAGAWA